MPVTYFYEKDVDDFQTSSKFTEFFEIEIGKGGYLFL